MRKISSHSPEKSRPLQLMMMDDRSPTHARMKLVKTYKRNVKSTLQGEKSQTWRCLRSLNASCISSFRQRMFSLIDNYLSSDIYFHLPQIADYEWAKQESIQIYNRLVYKES